MSTFPGLDGSSIPQRNRHRSPCRLGASTKRSPVVGAVLLEARRDLPGSRPLRAWETVPNVSYSGSPASGIRGTSHAPGVVIDQCPGGDRRCKKNASKVVPRTVSRTGESCMEGAVHLQLHCRNKSWSAPFTAKRAHPPCAGGTSCEHKRRALGHDCRVGKRPRVASDCGETKKQK